MFVCFGRFSFSRKKKLEKNDHFKMLIVTSLPTYIHLQRFKYKPQRALIPDSHGHLHLYWGI